MDHGTHDHDRGLSFDLSSLIERRQTLKLLAGVGLVALAGCGSDKQTATAAATSTTSRSQSTAASPTTGSNASCSTIPEETAGPYPADGSNGPNILTESGIVRSDIRSSFGSARGVAEGVPLTIKLNVVDGGSCGARSGAAVYLWHCDIDGRYSLYSQAIANENYLRGVQETGSDGAVTFRSIFPGAYSGRWPHIHFEVYSSLAEATRAGSVVATSQLALPSDACDVVYATDGYGESVRNLARSSLERDMVFSDGYANQVATVTGSVSSGFVAELSVPV